MVYCGTALAMTGRFGKHQHRLDRPGSHPGMTKQGRDIRIIEVRDDSEMCDRLTVSPFLRGRAFFLASAGLSADYKTYNCNVLQ